MDLKKEARQIINRLKMQNKIKKNQAGGTGKGLSSKQMPLQEVFKDENFLGWQVLDAESLLYSETDVSMEKITQLTSYYMKIIERLNSIQDPREQYFSYKMQKLMSQPYVIRCFSSQTDNKKSALQNRRKNLEQAIEKEAERQNHRAIVQQTLEAQKKKEERLRTTVRNAVLDSHRKLQERIRKRALNRLERSMDNSHYSTSLDNSIEISQESNSRYRNSTIKSTDFQLLIDEQARYRTLKRKIEEQQQQEREAMRVQREMSLWKNK